MLKPLRILITNWTLAGRHGSVMYVADVARALYRAGHEPIVYAPETGPIVGELRALTIPVTDRLESLGAPPDIILGNSHTDTLAALLFFPGVPGIQIVHAWDAWLADAVVFPRLHAFVAVDDTCRDWLQFQRGIAPRKIHVIPNGVDLSVFQQRGPLPSRPARAAVFSNYADDAHGLNVIREVFAREGIALDVIGARVGTQTDQPQSLLPRYDLVLAKARCALEAAACGCAVIACDYGRLGGMLTATELDSLRRLNFGRRMMRNELTAENLMAEIRRYDATDARIVSDRLRATAGVEHTAAALVDLCRDVLDAHATPVADDSAAELRAVGLHIATMNLEPRLIRLNEQVCEGQRATADALAEVTRLRAALEEQKLLCETLREEQRKAQKVFSHPFVRFVRSLPGARFLSR